MNLTCSVMECDAQSGDTLLLRRILKVQVSPLLKRSNRAKNESLPGLGRKALTEHS